MGNSTQFHIPFRSMTTDGVKRSTLSTIYGATQTTRNHKKSDAKLEKIKDWGRAKKKL